MSQPVIHTCILVKNGETYTQTAESDILVTPRVLTAEEAEALASLQHGEPKTVVANDGSVLRQMEINPKKPPSTPGR